MISGIAFRNRVIEKIDFVNWSVFNSYHPIAILCYFQGSQALKFSYATINLYKNLRCHSFAKNNVHSLELADSSNNGSCFLVSVNTRTNFCIGIAHTSAHPGLEGELKILATPNIEATVVRAETVKESSIYRKEASGHRRWPYRLRRILVSFFLSLRDCMPVELIQKIKKSWEPSWSTLRNYKKSVARRRNLEIFSIT